MAAHGAVAGIGIEKHGAILGVRRPLVSPFSDMEMIQARPSFSGKPPVVRGIRNALRRLLLKTTLIKPHIRA
jgi:hypothetical protein